MKFSIGTVCRITMTLAAFLFFAMRAQAQAGAFVTCVRYLADQDLAGKKVFQEAVRDLVVAEQPGLEPLASLHMSHQTALARSHAAKIAYLSVHAPGRIDTSSLSKFRNFNWSTADDIALTRQNPEVAQLLARVEELGKKSDGHPDWPKLQQYMRAELSPTPAFRGLMAEMAKNDRAVLKSLGNCRPD